MRFFFYTCITTDPKIHIFQTCWLSLRVDIKLYVYFRFRTGMCVCVCVVSIECLLGCIK